MKKFKEKRMASYVLRSNELIQEGKTKEAAELFGKGLGYYSSNIIHAITPYATADAGLISTVLRHLASEIEEGFRPLSGSYISQYHPRNPMFCLGQIGGLRGKSNFIEMQPFWKVKNSHKSSI